MNAAGNWMFFFGTASHCWYRAWFNWASLGLMCRSDASFFALIDRIFSATGMTCSNKAGSVVPFMGAISRERSLAGESRTIIGMEQGEVWSLLRAVNHLNCFAIHDPVFPFW